MVVLAGIQKKPFASFRGAGPNVGQPIRSKQIGCRTGNRPEHAVEVQQVVEPPLEASIRLNQAHVPCRRLRVGIESRERGGRHGALIHNRPKNIVDGFAQFSSPEQSLLRALRIGITSLVEPVHLAGLEQPSVFAEPGEINVTLQQFLGLDVTTVESVDEVEADVSRNQIKPGRTAPGNFLGFFGFRQRISLPPYYLTIKTILTS